MKWSLKVLHDTYFKALPQQSENLPNHLKVKMMSGVRLDVHSYATEAENGHLLVTFGKDAQGKQISFYGLNRWYIFAGHALIVDENGIKSPEVPTEILLAPPKPILKGSFKLPGYNSLFYLHHPIIKGGSLYWDEALHQGSRIPKTKEEVINIINVATKLQPWLDKLGKPFNVTSWYRPEPFNSRAGGASQSRHLSGRAIDGYVKGMNKKQLSSFFRLWNGGGGIYAYDAFIIHLDIDHKRRWGGFPG